MNIKKGIVFLLLIAGVMAAAQAAWEPAYALVGCRIITGAGAPIEDGVILIRNGLIEAVGPKAKIAVPEDAEVIDAKGLVATPGFIDACSTVFVDIPKEKPPADMSESLGIVSPVNVASGRNPDFMALDHLNLTEADREACHKQGILAMLVAPQQRMISGKSVLLNLNGKDPAAMVILNPLALHVSFRGARGAYPMTTMGVMAFIRQSSIDAAYYRSQNEDLAGKGRGIRRPVYDPFIESMSPYLLEKKPVVFACNTMEDAKRAMRLIAECGINGLIAGASEGWEIIDQLKASKASLLLSVNFTPPYTSFFNQQGKEVRDKAEKEIFPANAAKLRQAGLDFALTSFGLEKGADFLGQVRKAVKAGLSEDDALKALTIHPARILGVDRQLGTIEPGKIANVVLADGSLLKDEAHVKQVFVDGVRFEIKEAKKEAPAPDVTGKWQGAVTGLEGISEIVLEISKEKDVLSGKIIFGEKIRDIKDAKLEGDTLIFLVTVPVAGKDTELTFKGKAGKDAIEGTLSHSGGQAQVKVAKLPVPPDKGGPQ